VRRNHPHEEPLHPHRAAAHDGSLAPAHRELALPREIAAEREVARIAASQQGLVTTDQLSEAGFGRSQITRRVRGEWLSRRHVGVYQLGVFAGPFGDELAALLACGPRAVLSHWTAAWVFELCRRVVGPIHVTFAEGLAGRRRGIRPHRTTTLPTCDVVEKHGLRVTTPARTLLDLAAEAPRDALERLTEEAQVQRLASPAELLAVVERGAGRRGVAKLRAVLDFIDEPLFTRSEAEKRLRGLCRSAALPMPRMNVQRAGWEVDAVWDAQRLVVEVDGYGSHSPRGRFERDRRKDADLMLAGYRVLRITWRRLTRESDQVIALLAAALSQVSLPPAQRERATRR
jgi:very-short-patch-repair endonuclease